jgi:hypothetical protein
MTYRQALTAVPAFLAIAVAAGLLPGCAAKKAVQAEVEAVTMEYRLPDAKPVIYRQDQSGTQTMEIMGQYVNMDTRKAMTYTIVPGEVKDSGQRLTITIDSLQAGVTTPQGDFSADAASVLGKSFDMTLSATGKELDMTGAEVIQYSIGAAGQRSIKPDFQAIFPDLAGNAVKIGDTWTSADTVDIEEGGMKLRIATANVSTFEGLETMDGLECARISTAGTGTVKGEGEQQGAAVVLDSQMKSTDLWFFAYKQGMLARWTSDVSMEGTITVGGAQGMAIPMKQRIATEAYLTK